MLGSGPASLQPLTSVNLPHSSEMEGWARPTSVPRQLPPPLFSLGKEGLIP